MQANGSSPGDRSTTIVELRAMISGIGSADAGESAYEFKSLSTSEKTRRARKIAALDETVDSIVDDAAEKDPAVAAFDRIVVLCGYGDYSRERMRKRLQREEIDSEAAAAALNRAVSCGLIDDSRYAEALIAGRLRAGRGVQGIVDELLQNEIDPNSIEGWPDEFVEPYGDEVARALWVIEKNPPRSKNPRDSAYRRLIGKGYASAAASKAAGIWCASHGS